MPSRISPRWLPELRIHYAGICNIYIITFGYFCTSSCFVSSLLRKKTTNFILSFLKKPDQLLWVNRDSSILTLKNTHKGLLNILWLWSFGILPVTFMRNSFRCSVVNSLPFSAISMYAAHNNFQTSLLFLRTFIMANTQICNISAAEARLTLWTPGDFLPNSCRRRHNFSHTTPRRQPNFRKTSPGARRYFGSEKRRDPSRAFIPLTK